MFYQATSLSPATYEIRALALQPETDTVVHAWQVAPTSEWIGSNDDSFTGDCANPPPVPDGGSCYRFTLTQPSTVAFFVHRRSNVASGNTRIDLENVDTSTIVWSFLGDVGGQIIEEGPSGADISWEDRETLQSAVTEALPGPTPEDDWTGGLLAPILLVLAGPEKLVGYGIGNAPGLGMIGTHGPLIGGQPSVYLPVGSSDIDVEPTGTKHQFVVGSDWWIDTVMRPWIIGNGTLDLYINDASRGSQYDDDNDQLGNDLEQQLGTCPVSWSECPTAADSDGDGLWDNWEVIGGCTFFGCDLASYDAINFAYGGADPLVKDFFVQVDWERPAAFDPNTGAWTPLTVQRSLLAEMTQAVAAAFASPTSSVDASKPVIQVHFDYGQYAFASAGGREGPSTVDQDAYFCLSDKPAGFCMQPPPGCTVDADCSGSQACLAAECTCTSNADCEGTDKCVLDTCREKGCEHECAHAEAPHVYDPAVGPATVNGDFLDPGRYNLQTVMRGALGERFAFMPRNRRGTVVEL